jgi:Domain of unknown function (DUF4384)/Sel1 repeat
MTGRAMRHPLPRSLAFTLGLLALTLRAGLAAGDALEDDRAAAAAGDPGALVRMAERYETGDGVPFDLSAAGSLLALAAERGDAVAQYRLGLLQAAGLDSEADLAEAYGWLRLAAQNADGAPAGLLAGALSEELAERLDDAAIERAEQRIAAFRPTTGPARMPTIADPAAPGGEPAALAALLPPMGCGAPGTSTGSDGIVTLLAYAPTGSSTDAVITPGIRADLARRGAALDINELSPAVCSIRAVTARDPAPSEAAGVALAGAADASRARLRDGDMLVIEVAAAGEPRYVSVDYVVHTGQVWRLHPGTGDDGYLPAGQSLRLGDGAGGPAWQVGAPFGEDLVVVSVSPSPFGAEQQPGEEAVDAYRARLQQRMDGSGRDPVQVFEWVIETRAR